MSDSPPPDLRAVIDALYRTESRRVLATLIRLLGDFDLAEDALQEAFAAALEKWTVDNVPENPRAWLVSAGRFRAIDALRRRARHDASIAQLAVQLESTRASPVDVDGVVDDRLRLIFACCHPDLPPDGQVAITLREVCGLTTEEIARAFLVGTPTIAQRIVRAKATIREKKLPFLVPEPPDLPPRLAAVLRVIYVIFNEGYAASSGDAVTRAEVSAEAIRLGRLLVRLLPDPEVMGLLALMLFQESRRRARTTADGAPVLLEDQDRALWDRALIDQACAWVRRARSGSEVGTYTLQASIAEVHATAPTSAATDWGRIVDTYDLLLQAEPSPVVALNRAVAVAMRDGPAAGLQLIDALLRDGELAEYPWAHSARAELLRRLQRRDDARAAYERAIALTTSPAQQRFLESRRRKLFE